MKLLEMIDMIDIIDILIKHLNSKLTLVLLTLSKREMTQVSSFSTHHLDIIHDTAYDYYGSMVASGSSDQKISVLEKDGDSWSINDCWKAHDAAVLKLSWSHPEYGKVLASCGMDKTVRIWEENYAEKKGNGRRWAEKCRMVEARGPVQDVQFSPQFMGLKIACVDSFGILRIYEALDTITLTDWTLMDELEICSSRDVSSLDAHYSICWCPHKYFPNSIAVTCGKDLVAKIYHKDSYNKWTPLENLVGHNDLVTDISWAPNMGRTFELIATACRDGHVRIFKLKENSDKDLKKKYIVSCIGDFFDHEAPVWRVEWNITGTVLSSSGDDGKIRLWKASFLEEWRCITVVTAENAKSESVSVER